MHTTSFAKKHSLPALPGLLLLFTLTVPAQAAQISVSSYTLGTPPGYPDTGGNELTNGVTSVVVWATPSPPAPIEGDALVGWENIDFPSMTFNFGGPVQIGSATGWLADSDGAAGVGLPVAMRLTTPGGFDMTFPVANPAGAGTTVPITVSGFDITTTSLTVTLTRDPGVNNDPNLVGPDIYSWTMVSEMQFFTPAIPEVSTALLSGAAVLGFMMRRRR
jgi:hypothetical protein